MHPSEEPDRGSRAVVYCIVPRDLAGRLHEPLRRHFGEQPAVQVIVERRGRDRRGGERRGEERPRDERSGDARRGRDRQAGEKRDGTTARPMRPERRRIRNPGGRRVGERRAAHVQVDPLPLPRRARPHAERLLFVERLEPGSDAAEDLDTARLVTRIQAGDDDAFAVLYTRYFDRVYAYLRLALRDPHAAEDATQHVFMRVLEALPGYERRGSPFRAWLFRIVRNHTLDQLERAGRTELLAPEELDRCRETAPRDEPEELEALGWMFDSDLLLFIERLPAPQRQVLALRYMLDLTTAEIARVMGREPSDVRVLHSRALRFLRARLEAIGRRGRTRRDRALCRSVKQAPVLRLRRFALRGR